jgi:hypothetical protein
MAIIKKQIMMKCNILAISVLDKNISVKITTADGPAHSGTIIAAKKKTVRFDFEQNKQLALQLQGMIESVNLRKQLHAVIHFQKNGVEKDGETVFALMRLMPAPVYLGIDTSDPAENTKEAVREATNTAPLTLIEMLHKAAELKAMPAGELLFQLTSFVDKPTQKAIPGKRSVEDLSEKQAKVIEDKLQKILNGKP